MTLATTLQPTADGWRGQFSAMASPCEVLIDGADEALARSLLAEAQQEALRIEHKFSRYRDDSVIGQLHAARGTPMSLDDETSQLIDFAGQCHALSGGLFDATSGVLRAAWRFDGSDRLPDPAMVETLCRRVGWNRLVWQRPWLTLPAGMELDLGGIGKEYAVERVLALLRARTPLPLLVNFGGDLVVSGPRANGQPWQVGIERPQAPSHPVADVPRRHGAPGLPDAPVAAGVLELTAGALATSGDARRFLLKDGVRYGHILDPRTGWPVRDAPRSVTVAAPTCTEAGMLATLAMLQGAAAEDWLAAQGMPHWVLR